MNKSLLANLTKDRTEMSRIILLYSFKVNHANHHSCPDFQGIMIIYLCFLNQNLGFPNYKAQLIKPNILLSKSPLLALGQADLAGFKKRNL